MWTIQASLCFCASCVVIINLWLCTLESATERAEISRHLFSAVSDAAHLFSRAQTTVKSAQTREVLASKPKGLLRTTNTTAPNRAPFRQWAYATLVGGCHPDKPEAYKGMIYNTMIMARNIKTSGSRADIVVLIQMAFDSPLDVLPDEDLRILSALDIKIHYLKKPSYKQSFYSVVLEKFRVLELVEYSRVIFMDSDIMPFCSLDYLFDLSEPEIGINASLKENVVLSWRKEPSNCGFFMIQPREGEIDILKAVITRQQRESLNLPPPHFDPDMGWGHKINGTDDYWRDFRGHKGWTWDWHGVFGGQGLLYMWTKYVKRSVSLVTRDEVENWVENLSGDGSLNSTHPVYLESTLFRPFDGRSCVPSHISARKSYATVALVFENHYPYRDFEHFVGKSKPWEWPVTTKGGKMPTSKRTATSSKEYWYYILGELKKEIGMDYLNMTDLRLSPPPLGRWSSFKDMHILSKRTQTNSSSDHQGVTK